MSEEAGTEERIEQLLKSAARHGQLYDQEGQPEISDTEYDKLFAELATRGKGGPEPFMTTICGKRTFADPFTCLEAARTILPSSPPPVFRGLTCMVAVARPAFFDLATKGQKG